MTRPRNLRCSALPITMSCARSQDDSDLLIEAAHDAADLGSAVHDAMRDVIVGRIPDVSLAALRYGVEESDLGALVWYGRQAWEQLAPSFPLPESEAEVDFLTSWLHLTGHIDVLSIVDEHARFIDWKSGRKEEIDYYAQLAGYAVCLILGHGCESATASVVWLRSQTIETYHFTRRDVVAFLERLEDHLAAGRYRYGEHCGLCPRSHDCPALVETARRDLAIFSKEEVVLGVQHMSPADAVLALRRARALVTFADSLHDAIALRVEKEGPLDSGDGYALSLVEENGKREVDTAKAWPILHQHLDDAELASCVKVSASSVDGIVAKKAGKGKGAAAKRALRAELEAAGALTQPKLHKLKEVRTQSMLMTKENDSE